MMDLSIIHRFRSSQRFSKTGILVDDKLRPIDASRRLILENVSVVGDLLGGFDFTSSGARSGIALSSAFKAGDM